MLFHQLEPLTHRGMMWLGGNRTTPNYIETYLTFDLTVRASHLWVAPYTEYQNYLYETILEFRDKGWNFQQIADWFNENGITTVRGKKFRNAHTHSIVKKKMLSDNKRNQLYPSSLTNCAFRIFI